MLARSGMTETFTQRGGIRIGEGCLNAFNASWPFATFFVSPKQLFLSCFSYQYSFKPESILRLSKHRGLFSVGLRIEHTVTGYPVFLVFWTFRFRELQQRLTEFGYKVESESSKQLGR